MAETHTIVIGGTRGLGLVAARLCAARGDRVSIIGRRAPAALPDGIRFTAADLIRDSETRHALSECVAANGLVRYVIFAQRYRAPDAAAPDDIWTGEIQVVMHATRVALELLGNHFVDSGDRAVCGVSSVYGTHVGDGQPAGYHVAKAGFEQLLRHYSFAWGSRGVRCNVVAPCTFLKDESKHIFLQNRPLMNLYEKMIPLGRLGTSADSAAAIAFLCSESAAYITGQTLTVDGGLSQVWPETTTRRQAGI